MKLMISSEGLIYWAAIAVGLLVWRVALVLIRTQHAGFTRAKRQANAEAAVLA